MKTKFFMSVLIIAALLAPTSIAFAASPQGADNFLLPADGGWLDSGYAVSAGQPVTVSAYGQSITGPLNIFGPGSRSGPDGQASICPNLGQTFPCAMENAPFGALVGKIGESGTPFLIGSDFAFTPADSGQLYLAVNDFLDYYADNYGNYMVFFNQ